MTIELTPAQYETLLKTVYLGEWMINGIRTEEERDERTYQAVQHFYSYAAQAGAEQLIGYDKKYAYYFPTNDLDEDPDIERFRGEYENETFWDELIERMAFRDFVRRYGEEKWHSGTFQETTHIKSEFLEKYADEFEENGIENLVIQETADRSRMEL